MIAACPACAAAPASVQLGAVELSDTAQSVQLSVPSIRCAACIVTIEDGLAALPGVRAARVNRTLRRVTVDTDLPPEDITRALAALGYEAHPLDVAALGQQADTTGRDLLLRLGVAGFAMMNVMLLSVAVWSGATGATRDLFHLISASIAMPAVLFPAQPFFRHAWSALKVRQLNMDVPISLAILLAGAMSLYEALNGGDHAYFDAALSLTFFLLIGRYLEHRTRSAARSAANELSALEVHTAQRKADGGYDTVATSALTIGDIVLVPTGVRVPADGVLKQGNALTDRSFLTGESDPISHTKGEVINAGEVNLGRPFEVRTTAVGPNTRLRQIAALVETAENARNSYTSLADRAARIYAPAVHLLALVTFIGWMIGTGDLRQSLNVSIAVLIITCPCALGLAVPAVSTAAISSLYQLGFLVKSGTALERLADVKTIVFDKTGTLTQPGFVFDLEMLGPKHRAIAKALAQASNHPLSRALDSHLGTIAPAPLQGVSEQAGKGVFGTWNGTDVALGRANWLGVDGEGLVLKIGERLHHLNYEDAPLPGTGALAPALTAAGFDVEVMSGDTKAKTARLAERLNIPSWSAGMTPEDKTAHIDTLTATGQAPCMVGDGLNDTAALVSAHASIAPGSALDAARNAADVVMLGDARQSLDRLFAISRAAVRLSRQNFGIALAYNAIAIPIAVAGFATPLMAALAMSFSSITVLANAMRVKGAGR